MSLNRKFKFRFLTSFFLASIVIVLATGCDQAREKIAGIIKPKTVGEVTVSVNDKIEQRKFKEAQNEGVDFLGGKEDASGHLAWAIAKACAQIGEYDLAIKYASQALKANAVTGPQAMTEPLLEPVRTNIQFVSTIVGVGTGVSENTVAKAKAPSPTQDEKQKQTSTSISMDAQGTEVRAGDIVIKLPN